MFCRYCGNKLPDNASFCTVCGNRLDAAPVQNTPYQGAVINNAPYQQQTVPMQPQTAAAGNGGMRAAAVIAAVVVAAAAAVGISGVVKRSKLSQPLKEFEQGFEDRSLEGMLAALPEGITDIIYDELDSEDIDEFDEEFEMALEEISEETDFGEDIKISHKILDTDKISSDGVDRLNELYDLAELDTEIKKAYSMDVRFIIDFDNDSEGYFTMNLSVGKVDGDWKIVDVNRVLSDYSQYDLVSEDAEELCRELGDELSGSYDDEYYDDDYYDDEDYDYYAF